MRYFIVNGVKHWIIPRLVTSRVDGKVIKIESYYLSTHTFIEGIAFTEVTAKYEAKDVYIKCKIWCKIGLISYTDELAVYQKLAGCDFIPKLYEHACVPYKIYDRNDEYVETYYATYFVLEYCGASLSNLWPHLQIVSDEVVVVLPNQKQHVDIDTIVNIAKQINQIMIRLSTEFHLKQHDNHTGNYCYSRITKQLKLIDLEDVR